MCHCVPSLKSPVSSSDTGVPTGTEKVGQDLDFVALALCSSKGSREETCLKAKDAYFYYCLVS